MSVPTAGESARPTPAAAFVPMLRQQLTAEPEAEIVSIHLVVADMDSDMLQLDGVLAYAVETMGHETGNCISPYDGASGFVILAACPRCNAADTPPQLKVEATRSRSEWFRCTVGTGEAAERSLPPTRR